MKELTVLEQSILSVILAQKDNAYGVSVRQQAEKLMGKKINYGTLYNVLDQLLRKGYVEKTEGDYSADRIGRPRIYYQLTLAGKKSLWESYRLQNAIWDTIPDFVKNFKP